MSISTDLAAKMIAAASTWRRERQIDSYELGAAMREFRNDHGKSLRAVATVMGVSAPYLCDCERGFRKLSEEMLAKYIAACEAKGELVKK